MPLALVVAMAPGSLVAVAYARATAVPWRCSAEEDAMRAVRIHGKEDVRVEEVPTPEVEPGKVLLTG